MSYSMVSKGDAVVHHADRENAITRLLNSQLANGASGVKHNLDYSIRMAGNFVRVSTEGMDALDAFAVVGLELTSGEFEDTVLQGLPPTQGNRLAVLQKQTTEDADIVDAAISGVSVAIIEVINQTHKWASIDMEGKLHSALSGPFRILSIFEEVKGEKKLYVCLVEITDNQGISAKVPSGAKKGEVYSRVLDEQKIGEPPDEGEVLPPPEFEKAEFDNFDTEIGVLLTDRDDDGFARVITKGKADVKLDDDEWKEGDMVRPGIENNTAIFAIGGPLQIVNNKPLSIEGVKYYCCQISPQNYGVVFARGKVVSQVDDEKVKVKFADTDGNEISGDEFEAIGAAAPNQIVQLEKRRISLIRPQANEPEWRISNNVCAAKLEDEKVRLIDSDGNAVGREYSNVTIVGEQ